MFELLVRLTVPVDQNIFNLVYVVVVMIKTQRIETKGKDARFTAEDKKVGLLRNLRSSSSIAYMQ